MRSFLYKGILTEGHFDPILINEGGDKIGACGCAHQNKK